MDRADNSDILAAVREGRFSAETARRMMEIRAHSHQQALREAHQALDRGHSANYEPDEFAKLFNPMSKDGPLTPPDDEDDADNPTGPGGHLQIRRPPKVSDQQKRASAASRPLSDGELFESLYGYTPPPDYFDED